MARLRRRWAWLAAANLLLTAWPAGVSANQAESSAPLHLPASAIVLKTAQAAAPKAFALPTLQAAAAEMPMRAEDHGNPGRSARAQTFYFDGGGRADRYQADSASNGGAEFGNGGNGDGDGPNGNVPDETLPSQARVVTVQYPVFPGERSLFFTEDYAQVGAELAQAFGEGSRYFVLATVAHDPNPSLHTEFEHYPIATMVRVNKVMAQPNGVVVTMTALREALITGYTRDQKTNLIAVVNYPERERSLPQEELALVGKIKASLRDVRQETLRAGDGELLAAVQHLYTVNDPGAFANDAAQNLGFEPGVSQSLLAAPSVKARLEGLIEAVAMFNDDQVVSRESKASIENDQRRYYGGKRIEALEKRVKEIRKSLGDDEADETAELKAKIEAAGMPAAAKEQALKELRRYEKTPPQSADKPVLATYIDWLIRYPWSKSAKDNLDVAYARKTLDADHYGLENVKKEVLQFLAVRKRKADGKGRILCFVGPPGTGKTSIARSIARAMGRKYLRMALGGVKDESEIRGHRRTYIGALPGTIFKMLVEAGENNPVFVLDEIDKVGKEPGRGDPASALLEVLDPEQNGTFRDNYVDTSIDLSKVFFITTANDEASIPPALRDRMDFVRYRSYRTDEKTRIAEDFLIPKQKEEQGIREGETDLTTDAVIRGIREWTSEAGVRDLERWIGRTFRSVVAAVETGAGETPKMIRAADLESIHGNPSVAVEKGIENAVGTATGLAWTSQGGKLLAIKAVVDERPSKDLSFTLTGNIQDVMKESYQVAQEYIKSHATALGIPEKALENKHYHIHIPEGAIPKDGPSAGITMMAVLVSRMTGRALKPNVAMTGELDVDGKVLPIGGLTEKAIAAYEAGYKTIIIPAGNERHLEDIPKEVRDHVHFEIVKTADQVLDAALEEPKNPI